MRHNPEYRFTTGSGLDRSANLQCARTTDKGLEILGTYSLLSRYNQMNRELTQRYTHPNALHALRRDPTWISWNQYQNSKETMYRGEVGQVEGIRFVTSTEAPRYAVAAHSVNMVFVFGQQAYGLTTLNGQVEMLIARGPDKGDPFNQFTDVAYKVYGAGACLNPSAGRIGFAHEQIA